MQPLTSATVNKLNIKVENGANGINGNVSATNSSNNFNVSFSGSSNNPNKALETNKRLQMTTISELGEMEVAKITPIVKVNSQEPFNVSVEKSEKYVNDLRNFTNNNKNE